MLISIFMRIPLSSTNGDINIFAVPAAILLTIILFSFIRKAIFSIMAWFDRQDRIEKLLDEVLQELKSQHPDK